MGSCVILDMARASTLDIQTAASSFGTWALKVSDLYTERLTAGYVDDETVQLCNSLGQSFKVSTREWLERWDGMRDTGWLRVAV